MFCIERIFKDNEHYNDVFGDIGNAYVKAISWLFTDKAYKDERNDYCLRGVINTPEFMSCVHYFVFAATGSQPRLTINDYVTQLRTGDKRNSYNPYLDKNKVAIQKHEGKDVITFSHIEQNIIEDMLWSAYIYWHICSELDEDDKECKKAKKAILIAFEEHSYLTKDTFKEHFLVKEIGSTIKRFVKFGTENTETEEDASSQNTESTVDSDNEKRLQQKIDEQKREIEELKIQIENTSNRDPRPFAREFMAICHKYGLHGQTQYETEIILSILSGYSPTTFHGFWNDFVNEKQISKDTMEKIEQKIEEKKKKYPHK